MEEDFDFAPRVFEHEYWMDHFVFDESALHLCSQANIDYLNDFDILASDIIDINIPL